MTDLPFEPACFRLFRIMKSVAFRKILHMELLFWFEVCFPKYFDTLLCASGLSFDKKNFGTCNCFLGCQPLPWQGAGSQVKWCVRRFFDLINFLILNNFFCIDASGLGVGVSACLEMTFCFSSNNFPLLCHLVLHWRFWFYR